jgi:hypothetical protein
MSYLSPPPPKDIECYIFYQSNIRSQNDLSNLGYIFLKFMLNKLGAGRSIRPLDKGITRMRAPPQLPPQKTMVGPFTLVRPSTSALTYHKIQLLPLHPSKLFWEYNILAYQGKPN